MTSGATMRPRLLGFLEHTHIVQRLPLESFATNCSVSRIMLSQETLTSDVFVIVCATLSTVAFVINFAQMIVVLFLSRCWQSLYLLNSCFCGLATACALMYHALFEVDLVVRKSAVQQYGLHLRPHPNCGLLSATLTIVVFIGYTANLAAVIGHKYLASSLPGVFNSIERNRTLSVFFSTVSITQVALFCASLWHPWSSNPDTRLCLPPYQWTDVFSGSITGVYLAQMVTCVLLLLDLRCRIGVKGQTKAMSNFDVQVLWLRFILLAMSTTPFATLTIYHSLALRSNVCFVIKDAIQVWTLLATVMLACVVPVIHVLTDQVICRGTLYLLQKVVCLNYNGHALDGIMHTSASFSEATHSVSSFSSRRSNRQFEAPITRSANNEHFILCMAPAHTIGSEELDASCADDNRRRQEQFETQVPASWGNDDTTSEAHLPTDVMTTGNHISNAKGNFTFAACDKRHTEYSCSKSRGSKTRECQDSTTTSTLQADILY